MPGTGGGVRGCPRPMGVVSPVPRVCSPPHSSAPAITPYPAPCCPAAPLDVDKVLLSGLDPTPCVVDRFPQHDHPDNPLNESIPIVSLAALRGIAGCAAEARQPHLKCQGHPPPNTPSSACVHT
jgi:hypothetical protein